LEVPSSKELQDEIGQGELVTRKFPYQKILEDILKILSDIAEVESDFLRSVHALLRELDGHHPAFQSERERCNHQKHIIPLVHTLMYTLIKVPCLPDDLYERVYDFFKKLLTLPKPFCTIGLDYACQLKLERAIPGILYQRKVSAEQGLKNDSFPYQDKIFMFVDPDLLSGAVCQALVDEIKAAQMFQCARSCMIYVIAHAFQTGLKEHCDMRNLHEAFQAKPLDEIEHCFQEVMAATEHAVEEMHVEYSRYVEALENIYSTLLSSSERRKELVQFLRSPSQCGEQDSLSPGLDGFEFQDLVPDYDCCEQIRFSVLSNDSGIERDLPLLADDMPTSCNAETEHSRLQRKGCMKKKYADSIALLQSNCSGQGAKPTGKLHRKSGASTIEPIVKVKKLHTARVLVLGDDRVLGRLAQAYHSLRLKVHFYYVPLVEEQPTSSLTEGDPCELAAYLGRADPWYESNINSLCYTIPKLATMLSSPSKSTLSELFIIDVIAYYVRLGLQPVFFQVYAVKIFFNDAALEPVEDIFLTELRINFEEFNTAKDNLPMKKKPIIEFPGAELTLLYKKVLLSNREKDETISLRSTGLVIKTIPLHEFEDLVCLTTNIDEVIKTSGRSYSLMTNTIRMRNISLRSTDQRSFTVFLDKDSRRAYKNVISIQVFPCLEPSYCLQKSRTKQTKLQEEEDDDIGLAKYLPKSLLLPINTFAGIIR
ncbi:putative Phosphoinositide 3-kinase regulatory subunit 6-like protein, partial [Naja naja]